MAVGKIAATTASQLLQRQLQHKTLNSTNWILPMGIPSLARHLSTIKLTNNLQLLTDDTRSVKIVDFKLEEQQKRPLVVLLSWLMAKPKHVHKFANYYIDKGFDVLNVSTSPMQLLWPVNGAQIIADELLKFFYINESYKPIIIHGFSVGAYQWGEVLVKLQTNSEYYKNVIQRIDGHIWDSAVDYQELDRSVPLVIFPSSIVLQSILRKYMILHLKAFQGIATQHYIRASRAFHDHFIKAPALFLLSKSDVVGSVAANTPVRENWEKTGIQIQWKCWDSSPHASHFPFHTKEYIEELDKFLKRVDIPTKLKQ